jgi:hypothetical protein
VIARHAQRIDGSRWCRSAWEHRFERHFLAFQSWLVLSTMIAPILYYSR